MRRVPEVVHDLAGYRVDDLGKSFLGEGTYGVVYRAVQEATGRRVAIKKQHTSTHEKGIPSCILRECSMLTLLRHSPYIVDLLETDIKIPRNGSVRVCMVFELLDFDLGRYTNANWPLSEDKIRRLMYHMLTGLMHCHACGVMHRDLKPHNILVDCADPDKPKAKIADMGLSRPFLPPIQPLTQEVLTLWYRAPEVLLGYSGGHSPAVDLWSMGCIFAELYEKSPLFAGSSELDQLIKIFQQLGTPTFDQWKALKACTDWHEFPKFPHSRLSHKITTMSPLAIDLLEKLLVYDPCERLTACEALQHPYFKSILRKEDLDMPDWSLASKQYAVDSSYGTAVKREGKEQVTSPRPATNVLRPILRN